MTEKQEFNKALIEKYPFLVPDYGRTYEGTMDPEYDFEDTVLDWIPDGWRKAFGM